MEDVHARFMRVAGAAEAPRPRGRAAPRRRDARRPPQRGPRPHRARARGAARLRQDHARGRRCSRRRCPTTPTSSPSSSATSPPRSASGSSTRIRAHPLRREIVATALVNGMVNRAGTTFAFRARRGDGRDVRPRSCAPTRRPGRSSTRKRCGTTSRRSTRTVDGRHADDAVPRVAEARRAGEPLVAAPPPPGRSPVAATVEFFAPRSRPADGRDARRSRGTEHERARRPRALALTEHGRARPSSRPGSPHSTCSRPRSTSPSSPTSAHVEVERVAERVLRSSATRSGSTGCTTASSSSPAPTAGTASPATRCAKTSPAEHRAIADAVSRRRRRTPTPRRRSRRGRRRQAEQVERTLGSSHDITTQGVFDLATLSVALRALPRARLTRNA